MPVVSAVVVVGAVATAVVVTRGDGSVEAEVREPLAAPAISEAPTAHRGQSAVRPSAGRRTTAPQPVPYEVLPGVEVRQSAPTRSRPRPRPGSAALPQPLPGSAADSLARAAENAASGGGEVPSFLVASMNVLGSQHTRGDSGFGSGTSRAYAATRFLLGRGVSIVGFSELQRDQLGVFQRNAPGWGVYPGASVGGAGVPQSVAWDTAVWSLEEARTFSIPFSSQIRPQPVVRLSNVETGAEIWVVNVHNSPEGMEAERDRATAVEIGVVNDLAATDLPVVLTGDFNEKTEALCRFTSSTPLLSAVGGQGCTPPPQPRVDWIFATPEFAVDSFVAERRAPVPSITDHAVMLSRLSIS